jgi:hypothetical protein
MSNAISNFIPLSRKIFNHSFWLEKRSLSRFEAWLDMVAAARFDTTEATRLIGGTIVRWHRGEMVASVRFLAARWGWGKGKVEHFIKLLKAEGMITTRTATGTIQTIITICNFDTYNPLAKTGIHPAGHLPDSDSTANGQHPDETNTVNTAQHLKNRTIYRGFAHLLLFNDEYLKLIDNGHTPTQIDEVLDAIENYKGNKKYTSLYLTAKKWLARDELGGSSSSSSSSSSGSKNSGSGSKNNDSGGRIVNIANAFERALQHG